MTHPSRKTLVRSIATLTACLLGAAVLILSGDRGVQAQGPDASVRIGTYQPQLAFEQYHGTQSLHQQAAELQAQAEQNPDQLQQIQMQFQQMQQMVITQFQQDVQSAMPDIAEHAQVELVAVEVLYTAPGVQVQDLTPAVIEALNDGQPDAQPAQRPALPDMP